MMQTAFKRDASGYWIVKDPGAVLDYPLAWYEWLEGDTIATSTWTVPGGISLSASSINSSSLVVDGVTYPPNTVAIAWLSGGTAGVIYTITNRITTAGGRTEDRSFRVVCNDR